MGFIMNRFSQIIVFETIALNLLVPAAHSFSQASGPESVYKLARAEAVSGPVTQWHFFPETQNRVQEIVALHKESILWRSGNAVSLPDDYVGASFSRAGNYFALIMLHDSPLNERRAMAIQVHSANGKLLYEVVRPHYFDDALPEIDLSDKDGSLVLGQNTIGKIRLYAADGNLAHEIQLFENAQFDFERTLHLDLAGNGTFAALAGRRGASPFGSGVKNPSAEPEIILFDLSGREYWRKNLPDFSAGQLAISPDGRFITVGSYTTGMRGNIKKRTTLFDASGSKIATIDLLFRYADFSPDTKFLVLAEKQTVKLIELANGKVRWTRDIPAEAGMIAEIQVAANGTVAALTATNVFRKGEFVLTRPQLHIYDKAGTLLQNMTLGDETFEKPSLAITEDADEIYIGLKSSLLIFQVR